MAHNVHLCKVPKSEHAGSEGIVGQLISAVAGVAAAAVTLWLSAGSPLAA